VEEDELCCSAATGISYAWRAVRVTIVLFIIAIVGRFEGLAQGTISSFHTTVTPKSGEDVANPCEYELRILSAKKRIRALFVVFERGPELQHFYEQPEVAAFAREHDLAMLMPMGCPSKDHGDIDVDPNQGLGRALLTAVDQLSVTTDHPELKTAPLLVLGFSGAGALVGRLVGFAPDRIATAILSHAGQVPPLNLDTINLSGAALKIPELILVGGKDEVVGTELAYSYFSRYWRLGAPWLFATQNDAGHFCNEDATDLILAWLKIILDDLGSKQASVEVNKNSGYYAFFRKKPTGSFDHGHRPLVEAVDLKVVQPSEVPPKDAAPAGWLPSKEVALSWESFGNLPDHHAAVKH
jgi:predicted esterase